MIVMNKKVIELEVKRIMENNGLKFMQLKPSTSVVNDLGSDSLDFAELILRLEIKFNICISCEEDSLTTVDELVNTIDNKVNLKHVEKYKML